MNRATPMLIASASLVPAKSVKELVAVAKKTAGGLNYGSSERRQQPFSGLCLRRPRASRDPRLRKSIRGVTCAPPGNRVPDLSRRLSPYSRRTGTIHASPARTPPSFPICRRVQVARPIKNTWWLFSPRRHCRRPARILHAAVTSPRRREIRNSSPRGRRPWPLPPQQLYCPLLKEIERYGRQSRGLDPL